MNTEKTNTRIEKKCDDISLVFNETVCEDNKVINRTWYLIQNDTDTKIFLGYTNKQVYDFINWLRKEVITIGRLGKI